MDHWPDLAGSDEVLMCHRVQGISALCDVKAPAAAPYKDFFPAQTLLILKGGGGRVHRNKVLVYCISNELAWEK